MKKKIRTKEGKISSGIDLYVLCEGVKVISVRTVDRVHMYIIIANLLLMVIYKFTQVNNTRYVGPIPELLYIKSDRSLHNVSNYL